MDLPLQIFGEKGGLRWAQEQPNQLYWMPLNERVQIIERGEANLSPEADSASRVTVGHAEECRLPLPISILTLQDVSLLKNQASLCQTHSIPPQKTGFVQWRQYMPLPKVAPLTVSG